MYRIITDDIIQSACERRISEITENSGSLQSAIEHETENLESGFLNAVERSGFSRNAFAPWPTIDLSVDARMLPDGLSAGMLRHPVTNAPFMPAVIPFASANATGIRCDSSSILMQLLAFRLMLSVPVELVRCHFIDLHSFGSSAKHFLRLNGKISNGSLIDDEQKLGDFLSEMETAIRRLNRNELLEAGSLREYNANPANVSVPYHFVFISQIQKKISREMISRICALCSGMNAASRGIYFFYTYTGGETVQNGPLHDLLEISLRLEDSGDGLHLHNSSFGKDFEDSYEVMADTELPESLERIIEEIDRRADNIKPNIVSFDSELEEMIAGNSYWQGCTVNGIDIPIGRKGANELVNFSLAGDTAHYFAMIGGRPGYGKTVLLHDIICGGAIIYPPQELEFYLIDCTNGTGFKAYENLPHARFVSITRQREYTDSAIDNLIEVMYHRADLFKNASEQTDEVIEKIEAYRKITGNVMSRIIVIIDEFQVLLEKKDRLAGKIRDSLDKLIREGRKYGISIVFCTQSYRNIDFDTELITLRIAFNLKEPDSIKVLGSGNDSAAHLTKKGEAIMNGGNGDKEFNVLFQAAYTDRVHRYVNFCTECWDRAVCDKPGRFVFSGKTVSDLGSNSAYLESLTAGRASADEACVFLGVPMFIRESHACITFRKSINSNLLICGTDRMSALSTIALVNYQLCNMISDPEGSIFISDYFNEASDASTYLRTFAEGAGIPYVPKKNLAEVIDRLENMLKERIDSDMMGIEHSDTMIVGTIAYIQNAPDMRRDRFNQPSALSAKIQNILKNGPDYGIHLIVYAHNYKGLTDVMNNAYIASFGNQLILQGGATGMQLVQEADALKDGTALLVTDDGSTTYDHDPVMIYNKFESNVLSDDILDYIFTIYNDIN
ncbi:MAG: FtsK/SpoIIIE domain-containing protein [Bacteroidales bacterium]|nr:FtsK/SpoIIIE domain-containing protein [Bacteroidales bacterium]